MMQTKIRKIWGFSGSCRLTQLLVWIPIMVLLTGILHPSHAEEKSKYEQWMEYRDNLLAQPGLVAYYDFQEGKGDTLKNQAKTDGKLNGTIIGPTWTTGRWTGKKALEFDGLGDYVQVEHDNRLEPTSELTYAVWIRPASVSGTHYIIAKNDDGVPPYRIKGLYLEGDEVKVQIYNSVDHNYFATSDADISTEGWSFIVLTVKNRDFVKIYVNGVEKYVNNSVGDLLLSDDEPLFVGVKRSGNGFYAYFQGAIDEIAIYNRVLTGDEIKDHYKMGKP